MAREDLVVVHGGGVTADMYQRLAKALRGRVTVHLYNRRGRADAGPKPPGYTVDDEIADLAAVCERTGARNVLGHSYGGFVVMRAALELDFDHIVLYDGTVDVDGLMPSAWVPRMREMIDAGDHARAVAVMGQGNNPASAASRLPMWMLVAIARAFLRTPIGRRMDELLPTSMLEIEEIVAHRGPAAEYAGIRARTLLACGARSEPHYARVNEALAAVMPDARTFVLPRSSHNAPNLARPRFADMVARFLTGSAVPA